MIHLPDAPPPEENNSGSISGSTLRQRGRPSEKQFNDAASSSIGSEPTVLTRPEGHTYDADVLTKGESVCPRRLSQVLSTDHRDHPFVVLTQWSATAASASWLRSAFLGYSSSFNGLYDDLNRLK